MKLTGGTECYRADHKTVKAAGFTFTPEELAAALAGPVSKIVRDDAGNATVEQILLGLADTGFSQESVSRIVSRTRDPEDWRVGEAFAECHLRDRRSCSFPWPAGRDQRNPDSSPAGADLVGFQKTSRKENAHRFAFGEVKTSNEQRWPPQVMYGRHGLTHQLESLRDDVSVKDHLVKYLAHRATGAAWSSEFQEAAVRYLADSTDVALFGVLVRDVTPKVDDLKSRAKAIATGCPDKTDVELVATYFPAKSIDRLGARICLTEGNRARN